MAEIGTTDTTGAAGPARRWSDAVRVYLEPASLRMFFLGFGAGLPLLLVLGTLSFRLREAGIDRTTIGYLSWVGLAYGIKWAWAPLVDRLPLVEERVRSLDRLVDQFQVLVVWIVPGG